MVTFTQIPANYTPIATPVHYALELEEKMDILVHVILDDSGKILSAKRFGGVSELTLDIAPTLRREAYLSPMQGETGVYNPSDRQLFVHVAVLRADTHEVLRASPSRLFVASTTSAMPPILLTTLPTQRLIAHGECDELLFGFEEASAVVVTAKMPNGMVVRNYPVDTAGLRVFRLDTCDFPEAEQLSVETEFGESVEYTLVKRPHGAVRLAWRSSQGSLEHYTFPVVLRAWNECERYTSFGAEGYRQVGSPLWHKQIASAFEPAPLLEALSEILLSPSVWMVEGERYTPIVVESNEATTLCRGTLCSLELTICATQNTPMPWS